MTSKLTVVNQALQELGRLPVTAINDDDSAIVISNKLDALLPEMLLRTDWNFAIQYVSINTPLSSDFSPEFTYSYQLPFDFGRFDRFSPTITYAGNYRIVDGMLLSNVRPVQFYYVVNNISYASIPALFERALVMYVSARTCMTLTNNVQLTTYLEGEYKEALMNAILSNDMERRVVTMPYNDFDRTTFV